MGAGGQGAPTAGFFWALLPEFWVERLGDTEFHGACDAAVAAGADGDAGAGREELAGGEVTRVPLHTSELRSWLETVLPALVVSALLLVGGVVAAAAQHHRCRCCPRWRWRRQSRRTDRVRPAAPRRAVLWDLAINRRVLAPRKAALLPREPRSPALLLAAANPGFLPAPSPPPPPPRYRLPPAYGRSRATSIFAVLDGACS
ncbi:uncharacterized protein LOC144945721 [Lampetra fluviatilis]